MIEVETSVACRSDICSMWNAMGDTERLNRAIGNNAIELSPLDGPSAARYLAKTRLGGFSVQYEERPYEWTYLERFAILRRMRSGPVTSLEVIYAFVRSPDGGTRVTVTVKMAPRYAWLSPFIKISARQVLSRMQREVRRIDAGISAGTGAPPLPPLHPADEGALSRALEALRKVAPTALVERLGELLKSGSDLDIARLRPFELADRWKVDRRDMLTTCLFAVRAGLLELRWDLICPSCRTVTDSLPSLASLGEHGQCQLCELEFGLDLDEAVEATFSPAPQVRRVDERKYCIGGPARVPHVLAQAIVPEQGSAVLRAPADAGRLRLFVRGGRTALVDLKPDGAGVTETSLDGEQPTVLSLAPAGQIVLKNPGAERHVKLERLEWLSQAASARVLSTLPAFRRDFSSEVLRPGTSLKVARVTLLFTDLTDSTKLYADVGDAAAFRLVQDHFDVLLPLIEQHGGALVKTIGDAIMAVFEAEEGAVRASVRMLEAFAAFRKTHAHGEATHIKIGLYSGPCFAITANHLLDYFGQSVNIAARLQGQAHSGELVMESLAADHAREQGLLGGCAITERSEVALKGVDQKVTIARVALHP